MPEKGVIDKGGSNLAGLTKRKQTWHLRMRVPRRYRAIESRSGITRSLRTTSRKEAFVRLLTVEAIVIAELDARLAMTEPGNSGEAYAAGIALAASRGITCLPVQELAQSPMEDILEHIEALKRDAGAQTGDRAAGDAGGTRTSEVSQRMIVVDPIHRMPGSNSWYFSDIHWKAEVPIFHIQAFHPAVRDDHGGYIEPGSDTDNQGLPVPTGLQLTVAGQIKMRVRPANVSNQSRAGQFRRSPLSGTK